MQQKQIESLNLPVAEATERGVLYLLLAGKDPAPVQYLLSALKEEDFYRPIHSQIFRLVKEYISQNDGPILDISLFLDWLTNRYQNKSRRMKLIVEISKIFDSEFLPTARYFEYCRKLKEFTAYRKLRLLARDILDTASEQDIENQILSLTSELREIQQTLPGEKKIELATLLQKTRDTYSKMISDTWSSSPVVPTGFSDLDRLIGGWRKGEYIIIGGLPGVGKTTFALQIAMSQALDGQNVLFQSIEMTDEEMGAKVMQMEGDLPDGVFIGKYKSQKYLEEMDRIIQDQKDMPLVFQFGQSFLSQIVAEIERMSMREEVDIVYIDYFQRIKLDMKRLESKQQEYAEISNELSNLAKRLKIPIIVLSQLRREVGQREREPRLQDLKETGAIEQDADKVLFLHRESYFNPRTRDLATDIIVAKVRGAGDTGRIRLLYQKNRYQNLEEKKGGDNG